MKKNIILLISLFCVITLSAETLSNIESAFANIGLGARAMGMGGANTALTNNASSMIWNPAGLLLSNSKYNANIDFVDLYGLYTYSFFGVSTELKSGLNAGLGFVYSGDEAMSETTVYLSSAVNGLYLKQYLDFFPEKLNLGINLKLLFSSFGNNSDGAWYDENNLNHQVEGSAFGFAFDLGLNYKTTVKNTFAVMWKNPISYLGWDSKNDIGTAKGKYSEGLPAGLIFAFVRSENRFNISTELDKALHSDTNDVISTGVEYQIFRDVMDVRVGYSQELLTGLNKKYSVGCGFYIPFMSNTISLDIAYQIMSTWEKHNTLQVSCGYSF